MPKFRRSTEPRTFFLNETHELGRGRNKAGGRPSVFASVDWSKKSETLHTSLDNTIAKIKSSRDPLRQKHFFSWPHLKQL